LLDFYPSIILGFISLVLTLIVTPIIIYLSKRYQILDKPGVRKVHHVPIPLIGGSGIILVTFITFIATSLILPDLFQMNLQLWGLILGTLLLAGVGFLDDTHGLTPKQKFVGQMTASILVCLMGWKIHSISIPFISMVELGIWSVPFTILWITSISNALNMIDGLDGAATGVCLIATITCCIVASHNNFVDVYIISVILSGSLAGFLFFNFHPAKIFLGDTGSLSLGFILALLAIKAPSLSTIPKDLADTNVIYSVSIFVSAAILFYPILDICLAVTRRALKGKSIFSSDQSHIHHKLLRHFSTNVPKCTFLIWFLSLCGSFSAMFIFYRNEDGLFSASLLCTVILIFIFHKFKYKEALNRNTKRAKIRTKAMYHFQKVISLQLQIAHSTKEIKQLLQWTFEEFELNQLTIKSNNKTLLHLQLNPDSEDFIRKRYELSSFGGEGLVTFRSFFFYDAELERELHLAEIFSTLNSILPDFTLQLEEEQNKDMRTGDKGLN